MRDEHHATKKRCRVRPAAARLANEFTARAFLCWTWECVMKGLSIRAAALLTGVAMLSVSSSFAEPGKGQPRAAPAARPAPAPMARPAPAPMVRPAPAPMARPAPMVRPAPAPMARPAPSHRPANSDGAASPGRTPCSNRAACPDSATGARGTSGSCSTACHCPARTARSGRRAATCGAARYSPGTEHHARSHDRRQARSNHAARHGCHAPGRAGTPPATAAAVAQRQPQPGGSARAPHSQSPRTRNA